MKGSGIYETETWEEMEALEVALSEDGSGADYLDMQLLCAQA